MLYEVITRHWGKGGDFLPGLQAAGIQQGTDQSLDPAQRSFGYLNVV